MLRVRRVPWLKPGGPESGLRSLVLISAAMLGLTACAATRSPYHPSAAPNEAGYTDLQLENNRYSISFRGNRHLSRQQLEGYLLYRAAEITRARGKEYFVAREIRFGCADEVSGFRHYGTLYRNSYYRYPSIDPLYYHSQCEAIAEILLYGGEKPPEEQSAYQVNELIQHLKQQLPGLQTE